jgi:lysophospholipase L1-like esterase
MTSNKFSRESKTYKSKLWFWRISCGVLLLLFIALGIKTNYFEHVLYKLQIIENKQKSGDYWAKEGWTNTLKKLNMNSDIVFFGNSITHDSSFNEYFTDKKIVNLGYPGDNIQGMLTRVEQVRCVHPKKVFMMAGINGITYLSEKRFKEGYTALVDSMLTIVTSDNLYIQSLLPVSEDFKIDNNLIIERNELIKDIAEVKHCTYLDLHTLYYKNGELPKNLTRDGIHLYPKSYDRWAEMIKPYIYE